MATDMHRGWSRRAALAAIVGCAAATAAGTASAAGLQTIRVANFQNVVVIPLFHGIEKGYFKDAGIDVEIVKVATGAASVAAVASGQADIGWSASSVPMFARANGVKVKIFMTANQEGPPDHYGTHLDVSGRSGVTSFAQMKGKTVMINAFGTAGELAIRERLQAAGVGWDEVKKVVVPFPQMPAALQLGNADLAVDIEPMHSAIMLNKEIAAKTLGQGTLMASAKAPTTASCYFATDDWLAKHRDLALAFGRAYLRAAREVQADAKLRADLIVKIGGLPRATAEKLPDPTWFHDISVTKAAVAPNYDALVKTGMMQKKFDVDDVIATLPY
ncbi:MAG TPA: ABC transporter substrate-binding protein [Hyphomicrobiales bacterium]|nr:ABC transporter substrate-binding protein [Hyphomicrobiales bacterium]